MNGRHLALAVIAAGVIGMAIYLFVQVHANPAQADVAAEPDKPAPRTVVVQHPDKPQADPGKPAPHPAAAPPTGDKPVATITPAPPPALDDKDPNVDDMLAKPNVKMDAVMDQANKAYDSQDFDRAREIAGKVLAKLPSNVRMLRIMVSSSCIDGDGAEAQKWYPSLPKFDRDQMKLRCTRYGITLTDPQQ